MKKKRIAIISSVLIVTVWIACVISVNSKSEKPITQTYKLGETVAYEKNYLQRSDRVLDGYSVVVLGTEIMSYQEYLQRYQVKLSDQEHYLNGNPVFRPEYVYDVEVKFINQNNIDAGIDMFDTLLSNGDVLLMRVDEVLWTLMYPQLSGSYSFRLRPGTEMVFHLPFVPELVYSSKYDMERILQEKMSMVITQYPVKKIIDLAK